MRRSFKLGWALAPGTWAFRLVYLLMTLLWLAGVSGRLPEPAFPAPLGLAAPRESLGAKSAGPSPQIVAAPASTSVGDWVKEATAATAVATAMIAGLVAITTWGQWATNRARLRHELFDRRYEIYQKIAAFVADVIQFGRVTHGADTEFLRQTKQAHFAFGGDPAIRKLVDDIYGRATLLQTLQAKEAGLSGAALGTNVDRQTEVKQWFQTTLTSLEAAFEKYLRLQH